MVIFFEIKVYKNKKISEFKESALDIVNQLFKTRSLNIAYEEKEAEIQKIQLIYVENNLTMESRSMLDQNDMQAESFDKVDESLTVGQEFNYLERYVYLKLNKCNKEEIKECAHSIPNCTLLESLIQISSTTPIRNLRVEPQIINRTNGRTQPSQRTKKHDRFSEKQNCSCIII